MSLPDPTGYSGHSVAYNEESGDLAIDEKDGYSGTPVTKEEKPLVLTDVVPLDSQMKKLMESVTPADGETSILSGDEMKKKIHDMINEMNEDESLPTVSVIPLGDENRNMFTEYKKTAKIGRQIIGASLFKDKTKYLVFDIYWEVVVDNIHAFVTTSDKNGAKVMRELVKQINDNIWVGDKKIHPKLPSFVCADIKGKTVGEITERLNVFLTHVIAALNVEKAI